MDSNRINYHHENKQVGKGKVKSSDVKIFIFLIFIKAL